MINFIKKLLYRDKNKERIEISGHYEIKRENPDQEIIGIHIKNGNVKMMPGTKIVISDSNAKSITGLKIGE